MEEWVGAVWDRFISRAATREYPAAAVSLMQMGKTLGIVFRGLGGDPGLRLQQAASERHGARRSWLARIAGSTDKTQYAGIDGISLNLPERIALFPDASLNRDLYLWLVALAAHDAHDDEWIVRNQRATVVTLARFPGLERRYRRLVAACINQRSDPAGMPQDEAEQERAIRSALNEPGAVPQLPLLHRRGAKAPQAVPLWLYPLPETSVASRKLQHQDSEGSSVEAESRRRHKAERVDMPEEKHGMLLLFRAESLLSWAEYIKVNRTHDDDPDPDAARAAENMDQLSVAQDNDRVASRVRFDLDLPSAAEDDLPLGPGVMLPEWDYRSCQLKRDYCKLQAMVARHAPALPLPAHLQRHARRLRNQFACLSPARRWLKGQADGIEPDIDAWVRREADRQAGVTDNSNRLYLTQVQQERDLACLVLADLSLSTDAWVSNEQKVIDVIRDSLLLFAEALSATGDRFALCGFSSLKRGQVRYQELKPFARPYDDQARGMVQAIRPGYYTRLGAAIRHSIALLQREPCRQKLLLILSDGKPHDLDLYEGRYGIEDSRMSLNEARHQGIRPFCVTIDREGASYLPHLFGAQGYTLLRRPEELSLRLPLLYAQLTRG